MSGDGLINDSVITDERLDAIEKRVNQPPDPGLDLAYGIFARHWFPACVAEIRRLRAENERLTTELSQSVKLKFIGRAKPQRMIDDTE